MALALIFLVLALLSAVFGFTGIAVAFATVARFLVVLFLVLCLIALLIAVL